MFRPHVAQPWLSGGICKCADADAVKVNLLRPHLPLNDFVGGSRSGESLPDDSWRAPIATLAAAQLLSPVLELDTVPAATAMVPGR
ncbi:MAG: hypothetical protein ACLPUG_13050 [Acidimicrobiales bacterium]|jgi:hypothetical protein